MKKLKSSLQSLRPDLHDLLGTLADIYMDILGVLVLIVFPALAVVLIAWWLITLV